MTLKCAQCGAAITAEATCEYRFDQCMALEFAHPTAFGAVHHLTVASYMLQHNAYSRDGWLEARKMLSRFIRDGVLPAEMRNQSRARLDSGRRAWSFTKGARLPEFEMIAWTRTIADVRFDSPEVYCADVILWATSVLTDAEAVD